jgi:ABC-type multidrug transport system ATPase subunit
MLYASSDDKIVCPRCHYGFCDTGDTGADFACPRSDCRHRWEAYGQTIRGVHGTDRRKAVFEVSVIAGGTPLKIELSSFPAIIGRESDCSVILDNLSVSRKHSEVTTEDGIAWIRDLGSSCGTAVNGQFIEARTALQPRDQLVLGGTTLQFDIRYEAVESAHGLIDDHSAILIAERSTVLFRGLPADSIPLDTPRLTIGRATDRDIILIAPLVSSKHAVLELSSDGWFLSDVQSTHGTYINGKPIIRAKLVSGDRIQIGPFLFRYEGNRLVRTEQLSAIAVSAQALSKNAGQTILLDRLTFTLEPSEFVGLIGPSGAGKTTLLDALNGLRPATSGDVLLNDESLYEEYGRLKQNIGYVPQDDIIHRDLTIHQALTYAAQLRLPPDLKPAELDHIIEDTLEALDLSHRRKVKIGMLSGGQRKRVSVGVELLSRPGVIFLDEPTSGLDPGTESRLMKLFRRLADQGRTVVCTTHVMENIDLFHKIVVLAPGGRLAYFGPPQQAKAFFGIDKFCDLYERMEGQTPEEWQSQYRSSMQFKEYIAPVEKALLGEPFAFSDEGGFISSVPQLLSAPRPKVGRESRGLIFGLRQCGTLVNRLMRLQWADKTTLGVMLAQPLVIAMLICAVCREMPTIDFLLVISALWFGCSGAAQQIVKERLIYRRERMVNLRLDAYLLSKLLPLMLLTAVQVTLMLGTVWMMEDEQGSWPGRFLGMLLAAWNGVGMGLLISAIATNSDKAMSIVPLTLIPQIVLAGVLVAVPDMNVGTRFVSQVACARWATHACEVALFDGRTINVELLKESNLRPLWNLYPDSSLQDMAGRVKFLEKYTDKQIKKDRDYWESIGVMVGFFSLLSFATVGVLKRQDTL